MSFSESPLMDAALMAFDEINAEGGVLGHRVVPLVEDCASDAETYALKSRRLIEKQVILGPGTWSVGHLALAWMPAVVAIGLFYLLPIRVEKGRARQARAVVERHLRQRDST